MVTEALRELLELTTDDLWLCVENTAGAGGTIGRSVAELATLVDALDAHPRLGVCIDSCHWWASGVDVTNVAALDDAVQELDERIGLERLRLLHVNDAKIALGSNRDRHEVVARGRPRERPRDLPRPSRLPQAPRRARDLAGGRAEHRRTSSSSATSTAAERDGSGPGS